MSIEAEGAKVRRNLLERYRQLALNLHKTSKKYSDALSVLSEAGASTTIVSATLAEAVDRCRECLNEAGWEVRK